MNPIPMHAGRRDMAQELGRKLQAAKEAADAEARRNEGAIGCLTHAAECIDGLKSHYKAEGQDGGMTVDEAKMALRALDEACGSLRNLKLAAEHNLIAQRGKLAQCEHALDLCQQAFDYEGHALAQVVQDLEKQQDPKPQQNRPRQPGERPVNAIAARKKQSADAHHTRP